MNMGATVEALAGPWLQEVRQRALERFEAAGLPSRKLPRWRHTDPQELLSALPVAARPGDVALEDLAPFRFDGEGARLVLVDGLFSAGLSDLSGLPDGVVFGPLEEHLDAVRAELEATADDPEAFTQRNTGLFTSGAFFEVPAKITVADPVHVMHVQTQETARHLRHVVRLGAEASATLVESYVHLADVAGHTNAVTQVSTDRGARLEHVRVEKEDRTATHVHRQLARIGRDSTVRSFHLNVGGRTARSDLEALLAEEGASVDLQGVFLGAGDQRTETWTSVDHAVPHCTSHELFKGILDDQSHGAFTGYVLVRPDAQGTASDQENRNLLLSDRAHVDTTPQLEIHADDVKCSHGTTIGQLDEDAVFFLRTRGISEAHARMMLTRAFASEVLGAVGHPGVRQLLDRYLHVWFVKHHEHLV